MKNILASLKPLLFFQKRLTPPVLLISILLGLALYQNIPAIGLIFMVLMPLWHFYIYEVRYKNEYYFYFNLGFTRLGLWLSTLVTVVLIFLMSILL
jgi:hypothetical protein